MAQTTNVYSPDYDNDGNPKPSIPELKTAIETAVNNAVSNVQTEESDALTAISAAEKDALDAISNAKSSAVTTIDNLVADAQLFRDEAQGFRDGAQTAKGNAQSAASTAQGAASAAENHRDDAQQAATDAQESADDALASSTFVAIVDTESDLSSISSPSSGDQALVRDDTANGNGTQAIYEYDGSSWAFTGNALVNEGQRDSPGGFVGISSGGIPSTKKEVYVDAVAGSNANRGRDPETPVATLAEAMNYIGDEGTLYLKRDSRFHEKLDTPILENVDIRPYGNGRRPIVDQSRAIPPSAWSAVSGHTNVYKATVTHSKTNDTADPALTNETGLWLFDEGPNDDPRAIGTWDKPGIRMHNRSVFPGDASNSGGYGPSLSDALGKLQPGEYTVRNPNFPDDFPTNHMKGPDFTYYVRLHDESDPSSNGRTLYYTQESNLASLDNGGGVVREIDFIRCGNRSAIVCGIKQRAPEKLVNVTILGTTNHGVLLEGAHAIGVTTIGSHQWRTDGNIGSGAAQAGIHGILSGGYAKVLLTKGCYVEGYSKPFFGHGDVYDLWRCVECHVHQGEGAGINADRHEIYRSMITDSNEGFNANLPDGGYVTDTFVSLRDDRKAAFPTSEAGVLVENSIAINSNLISRNPTNSHQKTLRHVTAIGSQLGDNQAALDASNCPQITIEKSVLPDAFGKHVGPLPSGVSNIEVTDSLVDGYVATPRDQSDVESKLGSHSGLIASRRRHVHTITIQESDLAIRDNYGGFTADATSGSTTVTVTSSNPDLSAFDVGQLLGIPGGASDGSLFLSRVASVDNTNDTLTLEDAVESAVSGVVPKEARTNIAFFPPPSVSDERGNTRVTGLQTGAFDLDVTRPRQFSTGMEIFLGAAGGAPKALEPQFDRILGPFQVTGKNGSSITLGSILDEDLPKRFLASRFQRTGNQFHWQIIFPPYQTTELKGNIPPTEWTVTFKDGSTTTYQANGRTFSDPRDEGTEIRGAEGYAIIRLDNVLPGESIEANVQAWFPNAIPTFRQDPKEHLEADLEGWLGDQNIGFTGWPKDVSTFDQPRAITART